MEKKELAQEIIDLIGGDENISSLTHCVTRLRFNLKNEDEAETKKIDDLDGVMGVQQKGGQYQVIIGADVAKVYKEILNFLPRLGSSSDTQKEEEKKENLFNRLINTISSILVPSLAPIVGGGILKGFVYLFTTLGLLSPDSGTTFVLNLTSDAMFYFFPFLLALSSARKFKTNEYMALSLAGALLYPSLLNAALAGEMKSVVFLGFLKIPIVNYSSSIIPIILGVWLLSYVYRFFEDRVPSMVTVIFTPLLTLLIVVPITLFALAPIGYYAGEYIAEGMQALINFSPLLSGFVIGAARPFLVLMGMHHAIRPLIQQQISTYGYSTLSSMSFMSTMAQATAALAIYLVVKDKKMKQVALSSTISGYLGISEPALYGVLVKYKAAFIGASLGGGIGSAVGSMMGAKAMALVMPSILGIPVYLNDTAIGFIIGLGVTIGSTFILTYLLSKSFFRNESLKEKAETIAAVDTAAQPSMPARDFTLAAPVSGELYPLAEVPDATFAKKMMGNGIAIRPNGDTVVSPVDGEVTVVFKTKHAIGLLSNDGAEILLHIGIDTVELDGEGFEVLVEEKQRVQTGMPLVVFNSKKITEAGYDTSVIMVVTNTNNYLSVLTEDKTEPIAAGTKVVTIIPDKEIDSTLVLS